MVQTLITYTLTILISALQQDVFFIDSLKDLLSEYLRGYECSDVEKLREVLSKVANELKLKILQQTRDVRGVGVLHRAASRNHADVIATILSSLQSSDRLKLAMIERHTPLHISASEGYPESVRAILDSLTADQQLQNLTEKNIRGRTAVEMAASETEDVLSDKRRRAKEITGAGEFIPVTLTPRAVCP